MSTRSTVLRLAALAAALVAAPAHSEDLMVKPRAPAAFACPDQQSLNEVASGRYSADIETRMQKYGCVMLRGAAFLRRREKRPSSSSDYDCLVQKPIETPHNMRWNSALKKFVLDADAQQPPPLWVSCEMLIMVRSALAQEQVTTKLIAVEEPVWYTPDPRPECAFDDKGEYVNKSHPRDCSEQKHQGRRTERDWCGDLKNNPPDPAWCDAIWVKTQNTNHTYFTLRITVTCTAFDRAGRSLGSGSSDDPPTMAGHDLIMPAGQRATMDADGDQSYFRITKVKYADVARVDCRVTKVAKP